MLARGINGLVGDIPTLAPNEVEERAGQNDDLISKFGECADACEEKEGNQGVKDVIAKHKGLIKDTAAAANETALAFGEEHTDEEEVVLRTRCALVSCP